MYFRGMDVVALTDYEHHTLHKGTPRALKQYDAKKAQPSHPPRDILSHNADPSEQTRSYATPHTTIRSTVLPGSTSQLGYR